MNERLILIDPAPTRARDYWVGDVVRLRSGGPNMLVVDVDVEGTFCVVSWLDGAKAVEMDVPSICLEYSFAPVFAAIG
jgi:uncharacterized protein YodC (DUF2158 family)